MEPVSRVAALLSSASVVPASGLMVDGKEVVRRQVEWEREIETLDQKEMELHQSQVRLVREQTATFIRDLALLQQEVGAMKADQAQNAENQLRYMEKVLGVSADRHAQEMSSQRGQLEALRGRQEQYHGALQERGAHHVSMERRIDHFEQALGKSADHHTRELEAHKAVHSRLERESAQRDRSHATLAESLKYLEQLLSDSANKHSEELNAAKTRTDQLHSRVTAWEAHSGTIEALRKSHASMASENASRDAHHDSMTERLNYLNEFMDKQGREIVASVSSKVEQASLRITACERSVGLMGDLQRSHNELSEHLDHERQARERHHTLFQELIARERKEREKYHEVLKDEVNHHGSLHVMNHKELQDLIQMERSSREQHHHAYQEAFMRERQSRSSIEDFLQTEKAERSRHQDTATERVDSLQRTVNIFDGLIRKEIEERSKESHRIWNAIDHHTHDLSAQVIYGGVATDHDRDRETSVSPHHSRPPSPARVTETKRRYAVPSTTSVSPVTYSWTPQVSPSTPAEPYVPVMVTVSGPSPLVTARSVSPSPVGSSAFRIPQQQLRPYVTPLASPTAAAAAAYTPSSVTSSFPTGVQSVPAAWGYVGSRPAEPVVEQVSCGRTRYQGEPHREISLE